MYPTSQVDDWFLLVDGLLAAQRDQIDGSTLNTLPYFLFFEIAIIIGETFVLDLVDRVLNVLEIKRIGICKEYMIRWLHIWSQWILERDTKLVLFVNELDLSRNTLPVSFIEGFTTSH